MQIDLVYVALLNLLPCIVGTVRHGSRLGLLVALFSLLSFAVVGLWFPGLEEAATFDPKTILLISSAVLTVLVLLPKAGGLVWLRKRLGARARIAKLALLLLPVPCLLGTCEVSAHVITELKWAELAPPIVIANKGTSDWRNWTVMAGEHVPDPVVFWRPKPIPPRNAQGFLGPIATLPKPTGTYRIMTYGDSNTEGGRHGNWPRELHRFLTAEENKDAKGRTFEVLNAGCQGYSSYQGIMLLKQQIAEYTPDLITVSFGWNDLPPAAGKPDKGYAPASQTIADLQRGLLNYHSYRLLMGWIRAASKTVAHDGAARVSIEDYIANMREFARVAKANGSEILFLTRPHEFTCEEMRQCAPNYRSRVPDYNAALRKFAKDAGFVLVDVVKVFHERLPHEFIDECHFTGRGHEHFGMMLGRYFLGATIDAAAEEVGPLISRELPVDVVVDEVASRLSNGVWALEPIENVWNDYTHAAAVGDVAYFLHGRDVEVRNKDGSWDSWKQILPHAIGPFSAVTTDSRGSILAAPGDNLPGFRFDPESKGVLEIPALAHQTFGGAQLVVDDKDRPHLALGGPDGSWGRVVDGHWEQLPRIDTASPLGLHTSGLYFVNGRFIAFGDHRISEYDPESKAWASRGTDWGQLGMRPAGGQGGMVCQDPETGGLFMTLGKNSRTIGMYSSATLGPYEAHKFYFLRPRLPVGLVDPDRTFYITGKSSDKIFNILSRTKKTLLQISIVTLRGIGMAGVDSRADYGTQWESWDTRMATGDGKFPCDPGSCNTVFAQPYVYTQIGNVVRRVGFGDSTEARGTARIEIGTRPATNGSAMCFDGKRGLYLCNGSTRDFWAIQIQNGPNAPMLQSDVVRLGELPVHPDGRGNTAMAFHDGDLYAIFDHVTRILYRYDVALNRWHRFSILPGDLPYRPESGIDMFSYADHLWIVSKNRLARHSKSLGWSKCADISFQYTSDGGMATVDPRTGFVYFSLGGWSRRFGVIDLHDYPKFKSVVLKDQFPDLLSVPGRRLFIGIDGARRYLGIIRGHDTAEGWRRELPADGRKREWFRPK
jgi:lysophospholipase L1-like esterase